MTDAPYNKISIIPGLYLSLCLVTVFAFVQVPCVYPQKSAPNRRGASKAVKSAIAPSRSLTTRYQPFVDQQMTTLRRIFLKYDNYEPPKFVWSSDEIWRDLYDTRDDLRLLLKKETNPNRVTEIWSTQYQMEDEVLSLLVSNQLDFLGFELELNDAQVDGLDRIVRSDARQKHQLLRTLPASQTSDTYLERVSLISAKTDFRLRKLLFDDQIDHYQRMKADLQTDTTG